VLLTPKYWIGNTPSINWWFIVILYCLLTIHKFFQLFIFTKLDDSIYKNRIVLYQNFCLNRSVFHIRTGNSIYRIKWRLNGIWKSFMLFSVRLNNSFYNFFHYLLEIVWILKLYLIPVLKLYYLNTWIPVLKNT